MSSITFDADAIRAELNSLKGPRTAHNKLYTPELISILKEFHGKVTNKILAEILTKHTGHHFTDGAIASAVGRYVKKKGKLIQ